MRELHDDYGLDAQTHRPFPATPSGSSTQRLCDDLHETPPIFLLKWPRKLSPRRWTSPASTPRLVSARRPLRPSSAAVPSPNAFDRADSPHIPPVEPMGAPSHIPSSSSSNAASKMPSGKERVSDSGIEMADVDMLYTHDIAERAKLRTRARTQSKTKDKAQETSIVDDDVIELSTDDDELSILPKAKTKAKPKPRPRKVAAAPPEEGTSSAAARGKANISVVVPPRKRTKTTTANPDPGFESDVNTIPMPTSDFLEPAHIPTTHSSQLPPSDPPPSTSSSARTHPRTSQESRVAHA
ncbi:hypothetical protein NUW54_g12220 [Trametes sanguinea]|uniref:Uncharacterized protein n=1 Tax=Trametes sanguinea TaxID=158606 RepID=A0ACC1N0W4_9APHY|nr:hypothetical protein NUW54_g12220 [Trametes sanguinea]